MALTQNQKIIRHLKKTGHLTQRQAIMDYSIQSLTRRIADLRGLGFNILSVAKNHPITGQRYVEYRLNKAA